MARMYSRRKGKSASKRPVKRAKPSWVSYKQKEIEMIVTKLAKERKTSSEIGIILRDTYGIPDVRHILKKRITSFLKQKKLVHDIPEDLRNMIKKAMLIRKHLEANHKDEPAKRGLILTESKIKRLVKYYKQSKALPETWKYDFRKATTYIE